MSTREMKGCMHSQRIARDVEQSVHVFLHATTCFRRATRSPSWATAHALFRDLPFFATFSFAILI